MRCSSQSVWRQRRTHEADDDGVSIRRYPSSIPRSLFGMRTRDPHNESISTVSIAPFEGSSAIPAVENIVSDCTWLWTSRDFGAHCLNHPQLRCPLRRSFLRRKPGLNIELKTKSCGEVILIPVLFQSLQVNCWQPKSQYYPMLPTWVIGFDRRWVMLRRLRWNRNKETSCLFERTVLKHTSIWSIILFGCFTLAVLLKMVLVLIQSSDVCFSIGNSCRWTER